MNGKGSASGRSRRSRLEAGWEDEREGACSAAGGGAGSERAPFTPRCAARFLRGEAGFSDPAW